MLEGKRGTEKVQRNFSFQIGEAVICDTWFCVHRDGIGSKATISLGINTLMKNQSSCI